MKEYEYKIIYLQNKDFPEHSLNEYGKKGWKIIDFCFSDGPCKQQK